MFQVYEVNTIEELRTYQLAWEELWNRGRSRRFQLSFPWLEAYWKHSQGERTLKVLVATLAGRVIGILPLVRKKSESRLGTLKVLTYPLDGWGSWFGPIGPNSAATLTAGMRYLSKSKKGWDLLDFSYTDRDRLDLGRTVTAARNIGWTNLERIWKHVPYIELGESWDQFLNGKKQNKLNRILEAETELSAAGTVRLQHYRSELSDRNELDAFLEAWREIADAGNSKTRQDLPMVLSMTQAADDSSLLDMSILTVNNKPVAAAFGFLHPHGLEIVRSVSLPGQTAATQSVLLGRLLEQSKLLADESVEVCADCALAETARNLWATKLLNSYRYSCAPQTHFRSAALLKYHAATTPRVSQKRRCEPLRDTEKQPVKNKPAAVSQPVNDRLRESSATQVPKLKIYG